MEEEEDKQGHEEPMEMQIASLDCIARPRFDVK